MENDKKSKKSFKTIELSAMKGTSHRGLQSELEEVDFLEIAVQAGSAKSIIKAENFDLFKK